MKNIEVREFQKWWEYVVICSPLQMRKLPLIMVKSWVVGETVNQIGRSTRRSLSINGNKKTGFRPVL